MDKKKRIAIFSIAVLLAVLGIICITIAVITQDMLNRKYVNIIGFSSFGFWGLGLFILMRNHTNMVSSEMNEIASKMHNEEDFFSMINLIENPQTLEERFIRSGFKLQHGGLHKREFSFMKDYINFYVIIVNEENIAIYLESFMKNIDDFFQNKTRFRHNKVVYLFFFTRNITQDELGLLKKVIINQDVSQELPLNFDTVLPIVYDMTNNQYIIKTLRRRFSIKLLNIALRKFYKMIDYTK